MLRPSRGTGHGKLMEEHQPTTLLTGATGFLGQFILRDLLQRKRRVVALLRAPIQDTRLRLAGLLRQLDVELDDYVKTGQLILREGSLPEDLPDGHWGPTDDILACAASLQLFSNGNGEPFKTNVEGTAVLLDWARRHGVHRMHAVSTAYVCGTKTQRVMEQFHDRPPSFQTQYEESKWIAEGSLVEWGRESGNVLTVLRPSFLVGDSTTGYTTQFGGFYQFARLISLMKSECGAGANSDVAHIPHRIPGRPEDPIQNFVPVDYAARVIAEVALNPQYHGRIYHLTDPAPPCWDDFKKWMESYFGITGGFFVDGDSDVDGGLADKSAAESLLWEKYDLLVPRIRHQPCFDDSNTRQVREAAGVSFPAFSTERINTFLNYAVSQRWGQKANRRHAR